MKSVRLSLIKCLLKNSRVLLYTIQKVGQISLKGIPTGTGTLLNETLENVKTFPENELVYP